PWDAESQTVNSAFSCSKPIGVDFSKEANLLACSTADGYVKLVDITAIGRPRSAVRDLPVHRGPVTHVKWSPDGEMLATVSHDRTICVVNKATDFKVFRRIQREHDRHNSICWSPTGRQLAACGAEYGVHLLDAETGHLVWASDRNSDTNFTGIAWSLG